MRTDEDLIDIARRLSGGIVDSETFSNQLLRLSKQDREFVEKKLAQYDSERNKQEPANMSSEFEKTQRVISEVVNDLKSLLLEKNRKYGDSAIHPKRIFSKADAIEQINVRIDDKLSRIQSAQSDDTEDAELDLIGYLILKRVAKILQTAE
jgi:hypothetical protein